MMLSRVSVPAAAAMMVLGMVGCSGGWWGAAPERMISADVLAEGGLEFYWQAQLPLARGETVQRVYRMDENLYCLTSRNRLVAVAADTGLLKWARDIAAPGQTVYDPVHASSLSLPPGLGGIRDIISLAEPQRVPAYDAVMINTVTRLLVLDRSDGKVVRDLPLEPAASAAGATDGDHFYVPTASGSFYSLRLREGVKLWTRAARQSISASVGYYDQRIFVASHDGTVHCMKTGEQPQRLWTQHTNGSITAPLHVDSRGVFAGSHDRRLYAFNAYNGQPLWPAVVAKAPVREKAQAGRRTIFQYVAGDALYAVDVANGAVRWTMPQGRRVLAVIDGKVYCQDATGNLLVVDEFAGRVEMTMPMTGVKQFARNTYAPAVYAVTAGGQVSCIRPVGAPPLTSAVLQTPR